MVVGLDGNDWSWTWAHSEVIDKNKYFANYFFLDFFWYNLFFWYSCKWVGLFTITHIGLSTIKGLWELLGDLRITPVRTILVMMVLFSGRLLNKKIFFSHRLYGQNIFLLEHYV